MNKNEINEELEDYHDPRILSADAPVGIWLKILYISLPIWGVITFLIFWNGNPSGYWSELQKAANTTYPFKNIEITSDQPKK